jgi:hypothetical protein
MILLDTMCDCTQGGEDSSFRAVQILHLIFSVEEIYRFGDSIECEVSIDQVASKVFAGGCVHGPLKTVTPQLRK